MKTRSFSGTTDPNIQPYEIEHRAVARRAAAESIVLLKNEDHILPVEPGTPIALYGVGAGHTLKGGTGSGDVNERYSVTIEEGLKEAGYPITTGEWLSDYDERYDAARLAWRDEIWERSEGNTDGGVGMFQVYSGMPFIAPAGNVFIKKTDAEIAVFVLSRLAGEGADRYAGEGDYYLSEDEEKIISGICEVYPDVILVINSGGQVDLGFTDEHPNIKAILQISQLGCEGGNAFADVFSGKVDPSGKLTDTWALDYHDYPSSDTFSHNDGNVDSEPYGEGIFTGYRFFDSFEVPVRYCFGYGLSYTDFEISVTDISVCGQEEKKPLISVTVSVSNTGEASGREVAEVYVSCPQGNLPKEYRRLVGFAKTKELAPGESEEIRLTFAPYDLASYSEDIPGCFLEAGIYGIFVGDSLVNSQFSGSLEISSDRTLVKTEHICPVEEKLAEFQGPKERINKRRKEWLDTAEDFPRITIEDDALETEIISYGNEYEKIPADIREFVDSLSTDQLINLATGDYTQGMLSEGIGASGVSVPGSAAQTDICARDQGLADIVFADGPAGLRINQNYIVRDGAVVKEPFEKGLEKGFLLRDYEKPEGEEYFQFTTAFPVGTALAQSWDTSLVCEVGKAIGDEMQRFLITSWLAPGMNIHRNPLCGRNFEYYSEDPFITGKMAAAVTNGVQSEKGCGTTLKHFACNNQEDNRMHENAIVSERALREIYLKGFEIAVKEAGPHMMMTSYNLINGVHSANNYDLCTKAARDEWGFKGFIMTDWTTTCNGPDCTASGCIRAGNDIVMPGTPEDREDIRRSLEDGTLDIKQLKTCIGRIANVIFRSNVYE